MKGRFDANMYWMNPAAPGWASNNKYDLGASFSKKEGTTYPASAKLVRDRERASLTTRVFCIVAAGTILSQLWLQISITNTMVSQSSSRTSIEQLMICGAEQSRQLRFTHLIMVKVYNWCCIDCWWICREASEYDPGSSEHSKSYQ